MIERNDLQNSLRNSMKMRNSSYFGALYLELKDSDFSLEISDDCYKFNKKDSVDFISFYFLNDDREDVYLEAKLDKIVINKQEIKMQNAQIMFLWNSHSSDGVQGDVTMPEIHNLGSKRLLIGDTEILGEFICDIDFIAEKIIIKK
jgi:hypothetical protein